jgi:hypothetical protein
VFKTSWNKYEVNIRVHMCVANVESILVNNFLKALLLDKENHLPYVMKTPPLTISKFEAKT